MKINISFSQKKTTTKVAHLFCIILFIATFAACNQQSTPKVEPDIPQEKMVQILKDVHFAEAIAQSNRTDVKDSLLAIYYNHIYEIHDITKEDLERNLDLWMGDAAVADKLYEKVIEELSKEEAKYSKKEQSPIDTKMPKVLKTKK